MNPRLLLPLLAAGLGAALIYPWLVPNYLVTVGMLMFFTAFIGQSWNIAGGFAGQLSFGHVAFFGAGAYAAAIVQMRFGLSPWLGLPASALAGALVGLGIAVLSFRAGLRGCCGCVRPQPDEPRPFAQGVCHQLFHLW